MRARSPDILRATASVWNLLAKCGFGGRARRSADVHHWRSVMNHSRPLWPYPLPGSERLRKRTADQMSCQPGNANRQGANRLERQRKSIARRDQPEPRARQSRTAPDSPAIVPGEVADHCQCPNASYIASPPPCWQKTVPAKQQHSRFDPTSPAWLVIELTRVGHSRPGGQLPTIVPIRLNAA